MPIPSGDPHRGRRRGLIGRAFAVAVLVLAPSAVLGQARGGYDGGVARGGGGFGGAGLGIGLGAGIIGGVIAPMLRRQPPDPDDDAPPPRSPPPAASRGDAPVSARPRPAPARKAAARPPARAVAAEPPPAPRRVANERPAPSRAEPARSPQTTRRASPSLPPAPPPRTAGNAPRPVASPVAEEPALVPGEVLVTFKPSAPPDAPNALARRAGLRLAATERFTLVPLTLHRYALRPGRSVAAVVRALEADPQVAAAQPNHVYGLVGKAAPALAGAQYAVAKLHLAEAQEAATGRDIPVAIIDSGVDAGHPALAGAVAQSWDAIAKGAMPPGGAHAHGTAVAGLVGARGPLASPAPDARLLAVRAFSGTVEARPSGAQGTTVHVLRAVDWAASAGARVVNMSFAGPADALLARFLAAGLERGTVYIAAAGNAGAGAPPLYPAADPSVIAVTATDAEDRLYAQANRGGHLCVAAPGADILAATPGGGYGLLSGTSMAAPAVAGIVAMLLQSDPTLTPAKVRAALIRGARDLGPPGPDPEYGAGLADARASLRALAAPPATAEEAAPVADKAPTETAQAQPGLAGTEAAAPERPAADRPPPANP